MTEELSAVGAFNTRGIERASVYRRPPRVADCTLRDGEQQAGVVFSRADKIALARQLALLGVDEIEVGTPAVSRDDREAIEEIARLDLGVPLSALARARLDDVDLVKACGVGGVRISSPISDRQREAKLKVSDADYIAAAVEISSYAKSEGLEVIFSPYDTTRANEELLARLLEAFRTEGCVDRVRLVDTTGSATPQAITYLVELMGDASGGIPIEVHCHDDFGLATANTIAGALAGAEYVSVTVNGIGERAGNAALEEVVLALKILYGVELGIRTELLSELSREVERRSGVELQPHKAVVGRNAFAHETGMVVAGLLKDPLTAETYSPALVGQTRSIVIGKKSGRAAIEYALSTLGIDADQEVVQRILEKVKVRATELERALTSEEFRALVEADSSAIGSVRG